MQYRYSAFYAILSGICTKIASQISSTRCYQVKFAFCHVFSRAVGRKGGLDGVLSRRRAKRGNKRGVISEGDGGRQAVTLPIFSNLRGEQDVGKVVGNGEKESSIGWE